MRSIFKNQEVRMMNEGATDLFCILYSAFFILQPEVA